MTTRGIEYLNKSGIPYQILTYHHEAKGAKYAAHTLGLPLEIVIKSLVFRADDGSFLFALMSGDGSVSEKKLARVSNHKRVTPADPRDAERITAYQVGGISPLGAKKPLPVFLDRAVAAHPEVVINAGARGTMLRLATADLISITKARIVGIRKSGIEISERGRNRR
ncbi:MAG TPA: aminoacyl-tRNA deacylase [Candidatus Acetothermia bacterium]|nr:aminoacyl-tRNA deacylase [Candidatus Acetothermia bacterium]